MSSNPDHAGKYVCHVTVNGGTTSNNNAFGIMLNDGYDGRFEQSFVWVEI